MNIRRAGRGLFIPKPSPRVVVLGKSAADLLALSATVRLRFRECRGDRPSVSHSPLAWAQK
jgi:hypothetical protein